ncbi:hypothetical protein SAMN05192533_111162 [Mesobacillus persicus]|uniref:Sulfurtransferase n=1 Tax=Mesobacillus persicus TaxID=930146 RepID=A0A1H8FTF7_9BACI|nr:hypothetical protein [Mesobacillus persicus]SEN34388.1 hypothetical protein SAMN05192533_111162 [Mesobacillus persicus]
MITTLLLLSIILGLIYVRYIPVLGVRCLAMSSLDAESFQVVDVREYNQSYKEPVPKSINIPIAYIKRNYQEISSLNIHIIAADHLEKNMAIRILRKKGFHISGYTMMNCDCNQNNQNKKTA